MSCTVSGDSDIYGLGVRIGLYLTGFSCILARLFAPKHATNLASGLHVLSFVLTLALVKNVLEGRPAMLELYMVMISTQLLTLMLLICGALFRGFWSGLSTCLVFTFQASVFQWVIWGRRWSGLDQYDEGCVRLVRFFGIVDITGSFGTFLAVVQLSILVSECVLGLLLIRFLVLSPFLQSANSDKPNTSTFRKGYGCVKDAFEKAQLRFDEPVGINDTKWSISWVHIGSGRSLFYLGFCVLQFAICIFSTEDTLRLSQVTVDRSLLSTGQLLPLVIGVVGVLSVFAGWLDDRMERGGGEQGPEGGEQGPERGEQAPERGEQAV